MTKNKDSGKSSEGEGFLGGEEIFRSLANHSHVGIWLLDSEGTIIYTNEAAHKIWARAPIVKREEYQTYKAWNSESGMRIQREDWPAVRAMKTGRPVLDQLMRIERFDGATGFVLISAIPLEENGSIFATLVMCHDVTALKASEEKREELLKIVSHDLKNPLHAIHMASSLLLNKLDQYVKAGELDKVRGYLSNINRSVAVSLDLVRAILDQDGDEARALELKRSEFHPREIVLALAPVYAPLAEQKKLSLSWDLETGERITADKERLGQVISNLLGNAIKFTPPGGDVVVSCDDDNENFRFTVKDNGPGISEELLQKIFQKNIQGPESPHGTGLGLYIAQMMVRAHGGKIWAESCPGKGSSFTFTIPRKK